VKVAGGGPSVHACAVFFGAESRDGDNFNQTPYGSQLLRYAAGDPVASCYSKVESHATRRDK